jgi:hypothetical protein
VDDATSQLYILPVEIQDCLIPAEANYIRPIAKLFLWYDREF